MAESIPRKSMISLRTKAILSMVRAESPIPSAVPTKTIEVDPVHDTINKLYARPYSMTSSVFDTFCETQNTISSYHFHDLKSHLNMLNESFPKSVKEIITGDIKSLSSKTQELITSAPDISCRPIDLTCHEEMSILSPNSIPEAARQSEINNDRILLHPNITTHNDNNDCHMTPGSAVPTTALTSFDFDSDDSVRDKNYMPSDSSEDSDDDQTAALKRNVKKKGKLLATLSTVPGPSHLSQPPHRTVKNKMIGKKRSLSIDTSEFRCEAKKYTRKRRNTYNSSIPEEIVIQPINGEEKQSGNPTPKRRRYDTSLAQRNQEKKDKKMMEYVVKSGCNDKCLKKCSSQFNEQDRENINKEYWSLTWEQRRLYIQSKMATAVPKRKYTSDPKRKPKRSFQLHARDGTLVEVCKIFFLTTLGYKKSNDKILRIDHSAVHDDKRGKHSKTPLYNREILTKHVESFEPTEPHYRREHAPLRRYLPSDINITHMHNDFCEKYPDQTVSYELYRKHVKNMNISFTRLGNEECEACESYKLHKLQTSHDVTAQLVAECNNCVEFAKHHDRYTKARQLYASHKTLLQNAEKIFFTADLEKVIMLPRMETFKAVIFAQRLVAFNQTFAPVGKITTLNKPMAVIWHDAVAGRKQEDIMSAFYTFIIRNRDVREINIWLDNCSAQNKNWLLFSLLVHLVNSDLISTTNITLYFFEPGHTFMSADQVHHQVELAMKKMGKLYDFTDFKEAVSSVNNGKVSVESLEPQNFLNLPNYISDRRIQKSNPRAYLKNMVQVSFQRTNFGLLYKNDFDDEFTSLQFMKDNYLKNPSALAITFRTTSKGLEPHRKAGIIDKLATIIPPHKLLFWRNLPISE